MSLKIDTFEILPKFAGSTSTTAEEMKTYVKAFADKLCTLLGLVVMEELTQEHTYGAYYFLGEAGSAYPIMYVGNTENAGWFFKNVYIGITNSSKGITSKPSTNIGANSSGYYGIDVSNYTYNLKYVQTENTTMFSIYRQGETIYYTFTVEKVNTENGEKRVFAFVCTNSEYFSYIPEFGEGSQLYINSNPNYKSFIPNDKECIINCVGIGTAKFPNLYYFTNKMQFNAGTFFTVGKEKYMVAIKGSGDNMSLVMKIT